MRIVGGHHRGRQLETPAELPIRPTSDRARESLFNILEHSRLAAGGLSPVRSAHVLDAFCGTGALGLEALSRGAAHAVFVDNDPAALRLAKRNAARLGVAAQATFVLADATRPPSAAAQPCGLVFLDPPYDQDVLGPAVAALTKSGWIAPGAILIVEVERRRDVILSGYALVDERRYGKAKLLFYRG